MTAMPDSDNIVPFPGDRAAAAVTPTEVPPTDVQRALYRCLAYDADDGSARFTWGEVTWDRLRHDVWRTRILTGDRLFEFTVDTIPTPRILHLVHLGMTIVRCREDILGIAEADRAGTIAPFPAPEDR